MYFVYILTNKTKTVLYTGVINNLYRRVIEHKEKVDIKSFTAKYNVNLLVYYETTTSSQVAIEREKQIKGGSRKKKIELINSFNPTWTDLLNDIQP